jgi:hypothetical protein
MRLKRDHAWRVKLLERAAQGDEGEKEGGGMAEINDVLAELRQRIMGPVENGPPKSARPQHQETNGGGPEIAAKASQAPR